MSKSILIVDDEATIRFALSEYFSTLGYSVETAGEREEAEFRARMEAEPWSLPDAHRPRHY